MKNKNVYACAKCKGGKFRTVAKGATYACRRCGNVQQHGNMASQEFPEASAAIVSCTEVPAISASVSECAPAGG